MNVQVVRTDENGKRFNRYDQEVIACERGCGRDTTMTGTKLCDHCWETDRDSMRTLPESRVG